MDSFYTFFNKTLGKASELAFQLFWNGEYEKCYQFYCQVISNIGSIEAMGFQDTLIYQHCSLQIGIDSGREISIPPPPNRDELINLYEYEISQEKSSIKTTTRGILSQPLVLNKAILAAFIGVNNECEHAVETGTYLGGSSYLFSGVFENVQTIEADPKLHESSRAWLSSKTKNIQCHLGNSSAILSQVIEPKRKTLVFLDAHYSTGITSKEYGICPLLGELEILINSDANIVIVVDDIRCMGTSGYPHLKEIIDIIPEGRKVTIQYDQLIIV